MGLCPRSDPPVARKEKTPRPSCRRVRGRIRFSLRARKARLAGRREGLSDGRGASQDVRITKTRPTKAYSWTRGGLENREGQFVHGHITTIMKSQRLSWNSKVCANSYLSSNHLIAKSRGQNQQLGHGYIHSDGEPLPGRTSKSMGCRRSLKNGLNSISLLFP